MLLFAVLFGFSLHHIGEKGKAIFNIIDGFSQVIFGIINMIMKLAPVGAFGAMAFTIGKYGIGSGTARAIDRQLLSDLSAVYFPGAWQYRQGKWLQHSALYFLHPGRAADRARHFLIGIVLPRMLVKMEALGCKKSVVGLVIPTGYSFNLTAPPST